LARFCLNGRTEHAIPRRSWAAIRIQVRD
jgi:hypothetical protein